MNKQSKDIRVILADDHAVVRAGIRQFLENEDDIHVIAEADDGETAYKLIQENRPDVAVLDIQMPRASGIEVTRRVKTDKLGTGLLILTAYDEDPYVKAVLKAGANGYVLKTASPDDIIEAVRDVNEGKSVLDATIAKRMALHTLGKDTQSPESLTDREIEVLTLAAKGLTNKAIGVQLGISNRTVQGHLAHAYEKLQAGSRTEAVMRALSLGFLSEDVLMSDET